MEILDEKRTGQCIVRIKGSLDYIAAPSLRSFFREKVADGESHIKLNLESMDYISSAGFGVLLYAKKEVEKIGGILEINSLNPNVREVFKMAGLFSVFNIEIAD